MKNSSYKKGKRWGFAIFRKNVATFGKVGITKSYAASLTCSKYASTGKKKGKALTNDDILFYKGAVAGFQEYYNKKINK